MSSLNLDESIVISTRVRLARNLQNMNFPPKMSAEDFDALDQRIISRVNGRDDFNIFKMNELDLLSKQALVERHQASPALVNRREGMLLLNENSTVSIMVGEEDHLRIQALLPGLQLQKADELTREIDAIIAPEEYAFSNQFGYLTTCPTNAGTGMRASVMLHLSALSSTGNIRKIVESVSQYGYIMRGYYGEGSEAYGDMYQLSNQITLGVSEEEILLGLSQLIETIVMQEQQIREKLFKDATFIDKLARSFGVLKYAQYMEQSEMMQRLSDLKAGIASHMVEGISLVEVDELLVQLQPAILTQTIGDGANANTCNRVRADEIRKKLKNTTFV